MAPETDNRAVFTIIVAAGRGRRCPGPQAKQFLSLCNRPLYLWSVAAFEKVPAIKGIILVGPAGDPEKLAAMRLAVANYPKVIGVVAGGESRTASVACGLKELERHPEISAQTPILIHDGARPLITPELIRNVSEKISSENVVIPVTKPAATVKLLAKGEIRRTLPRDEIGLAQTPQGMVCGILRQALEFWQQNPQLLVTDDGQLVENLFSDQSEKISIIAVQGEECNLKITYPEDLKVAEALCKPDCGVSGDTFQLRWSTGFGYDVHAFADKRKLILGGVEIPGHPGLAGHSDADVLIHALVDAILGAIGGGDIGRLFPDHDPSFKDRSSLYFLDQVLVRMRESGFQLQSADITVVAEKPKLAPHIPAMLRCLRETVKQPCQLNIKATTSEGLGFTGRREGIAAYAVATVAAG
jgi:2-C-methyl-D-erythritol 2,4-cyclodiphosphate synthase/2-C-methyl-D-erythritol 4-phosphate cytidylyltransferase